jgi:uncharacterized lipoprotein YmbA
MAALSALGGLLLVVSAMTGGCSLRKQSPAKLRYLVEAKRPGGPTTATAQATLRVRNLQIAAPFEGKGFVYRNSGQNYETDFYHEFLIPPQLMLTEQVRQWLGASGLFRAVPGPASKLDSSHSLEGDVTALYGDFRDQATPKVVLEIHFLIVNDQGSSPQIVLQKSYRQEVKAESHSPEALVAGWSNVLAKILAELERDLADVRGLK